MVSGGHISEQKKRTARSKRLPEPDICVAAGTLSDETLQRLIDEWIVPGLVDEFLRPESPCHVGQFGMIMEITYEMRRLC